MSGCEIGRWPFVEARYFEGYSRFTSDMPFSPSQYERERNRERGKRRGLFFEFETLHKNMTSFLIVHDIAKGKSTHNTIL